MKLTRRSILTSFPALALASEDRLAAHAYVFTQDAATRKLNAADEPDRVFGTIADAGFRHVELMSSFLHADVAANVLASARKHKLTVPIVYVGDVMHTAEGASATLAEAMHVAKIAKAAGLRAINHNPQPKPGKQRKTDDELARQADGLNRLGEALRKLDVLLLYHTHDPEMADNAREWRHVVRNTNPELVKLCMDTHWIHRGGQDPVALLREAGKRTGSLHLRNSRSGIWSETFGSGDVDYDGVARIVKELGIQPWLVVELAREKGTAQSMSLVESLRASREYARTVFAL